MESIVVTIFPVLFLIVLFGGGALFQRKNIDMDGEPPINRSVFYTSKYSIVIIWGAMVAHSWGVNLALFKIPGLVKGISLVLWVLGFLFLLWGRFEMGNSFRLGSPKETITLKSKGLFRISRNPMYVGVFLTLLGATIHTLNPIVFLIVIFIIAVHHKIVLAEEQFLQKSFGQVYSDYCQRVRRYL